MSEAAAARIAEQLRRAGVDPSSGRVVRAEDSTPAQAVEGESQKFERWSREAEERQTAAAVDRDMVRARHEAKLTRARRLAVFVVEEFGLDLADGSQPHQFLVLRAGRVMDELEHFCRPLPRQAPKTKRSNGHG
jgi:hypothetical protein